MHIRRLTLAIVAMIIVGVCACSAYNPGDPEFRAIYVDAWHPGCRNASEINTLISNAHYCNANTIVVEVRRRGDTIYPSGEPTASGFSPSFDSLADLVQKCHSTSPRLDVQAWFVVWPIESDPATSDPNHPYNRYPQYLTKTYDGATSISGDFWFDPGHPGAAQYTYNVIMDVVNRYDVDGINLDYIRYGYTTAGYNDVSVARFNARYGRTGKPSSGDSVWSDWRREQLTNFVRKCYANAIAVKPNIKMTADCYDGTPSPSDLNDFILHSQAYNMRFQNWPAWMQEGILDMSIPMAYYDCADDYHFDRWLCFTRNYAYNRQCAMAIGLSCIGHQLDDTRNLCGGTNGAAIYAYNGMQLSPSLYDEVRSKWTTPAPVPTMPWKSAPTKGHIKGNVTFAGSVWIDGATITLTGAANRGPVYADGTGFFAFIDLPHGNYTVTCVANGYGTITTNNIHVDVGQVVDVPCDYPISSLIISNVQAGSETATGATITWTTNAGASSKVYYGLDRTCSSSTTEDATQVTAHSVPLTGLLPATIYYYRVYSMNPGAPAAMSPVYALVTMPPRSDDFIVESRSGGLNSGNFTYSGPATSTAKSTASGLTFGIGSYYAGQTSPSKWGQWSYTPTVSGSYKVYATWATNAYASDVPAPTWTVNNAGTPVTISIAQTAGANVWNLLTTGGDVQLNSGVAYTVSLATNPDGVSNKRTYFDSVKFAWVATDSTSPSTPTDLAATTVQDDLINLGWTASTDNVAVAGYRISRGPSSAVTVIDSSPTNSYSDTDVLPNTRYYYAVSAYDTSGNKSGTSTQINLYSLTAKPSSATVTCDKQAGVWHTAGPFTFTAVGGFGAGKVAYYRYAWDTNPSHTWLGTESTWVSGTKSCTATSSASPYYLHIRGYNQASPAVPGDPADLGPYYIDSTAPDTPTVTDDGVYSPSQTSVHACWSATDPESPIIGYQYAVGTTSGGTNLVNWTTTTDTSATITIPSQSYGTMIYVSVKAENASLLWSGAGNSDGIKVAQAVASTAEAKSLIDGTLIYLSDRTVSAVFSDCFYVQDPESDKKSGIRAEGICPYAVGTIVNVGGYLSTTAAKERTITSAEVTLAP